MMSGPLPISTKSAVGPDPASIPGNREGASPPVSGGKPDTPPESVDLRAITAELNHKINRIHNVNLQLSVHEGTGQLLVKVMDAATGELIREIPPSEILDLAARLEEMIGLIFDQVG